MYHSLVILTSPVGNQAVPALPTVQNTLRDQQYMIQRHSHQVICLADTTSCQFESFTE